MHCERHQFTGLTVDGGFADYVIVAERSLVKLPPGVDPVALAPYADAGSPPTTPSSGSPTSRSPARPPC